MVTSDKGNSPLIAAYMGSMDFIVPFVRESGSARYANQDGDTLLHAAADGWQYGMAEFLIISGADPNAKNKNSETPLHMLALRRKEPHPDGFFQCTEPLELRDKTLEVLLLRQANPDLLDNNGFSPLHISAIAGDLPLVKRLAISGYVDTQTNKGATALALAVLYEHAKCAEWLIKFGANVNVKYPSGETVHDLIIASNNNEISILQKLC